MFICYVCFTEFRDIKSLSAHLRRHESAGEIRHPVRCRQNNCSSTFSTVWCLSRHLQKFHAEKNEQPLLSMPVASDISQSVMNPTTVTEYPSTASPVSPPGIQISDIQSEGVSLVVALHSNSSVPKSVISQVISTVNQMAECTSSYLKNEIIHSIKSAGVTDDVIKNIEATIDSTRQPLDFLSSVHKQNTYFRNHPLFVQPQSIHLGSRYDVRGGQNVLVYDCYEYVSVENVIRSLLQSPEYIGLVFSAKNQIDSDTISDASCGLRFKDHELFSDASKYSLRLQLFYDGMGTTNPLRGNSMCNLGVFYYTVQNLPLWCNSCFANVHLLALCYSSDIKVYGFDKVLERFVWEMNKLQTVGISGDFPIIGTQTVYVGLGHVTCDNLALNGLYGFIECFSGDYFCTMCYTTSDEFQQFFYESDFQLRTVDSYAGDVTSLNSLPAGTHCRGVKARCRLNDIEGFHVTDNYCVDPLHTLLEGIVPYEMGCVLYNLITVKHYLTLTRLNDRIRFFFDRNVVDKRNRPPALNRIEMPGHCLSPSMKAVQMWSLLKFLPLIIGDLVPYDDQYWKFLLHLSELVDLIFAPSFTKGMTIYLREFIADHLIMFKSLFGPSLHLKPKHHLLVHIPSVIIKNGPVVGMSCLRYELKNSFFKRSAGIVCNFTNICKTLASRHQYNAFYSLLNKEFLRDKFHVGQRSSECLIAGEVECFGKLFEVVGCDSSDEIVVTTQITVGTVVYKRGNFLLIGYNFFDDPVFACIQTFVSLRDSDRWWIVLHPYHTVKFRVHFHAYEVEQIQPVVVDIVKFEQLPDHSPLFGYTKCLQTKTTLIRMCYHVCSTGLTTVAHNAM